MNKMSKTNLLLSSIVGVAASLVACRSNDLGSAEPDKIQVNLSLSGWDSGAGLVIIKKCANCHTSQRSASVPANTPYNLDGIESLDFFKNPENRGIARAMRKRIESSDPLRQMPPKFATPLYDDEKAAVLAFLKTIESESGQTEPCPKNTSLSLLKHGDDDGRPRPPGDDDDQPRPNPTPSNPGSGSGQPGQVVDNGGSAPCDNNSGGGGSNPPSGGGSIPPSTEVTFNDIQPIIQKACGSCHGPGARLINLVTREDFVAAGSLPLDEITAGSMPKRYTGTPPWKETPDGKLVIQWLQGDMSQ